MSHMLGNPNQTLRANFSAIRRAFHKAIGVGTGTVQRIKEEMTGPFVGAAA